MTSLNAGKKEMPGKDKKLLYFKDQKASVWKIAFSPEREKQLKLECEEYVKRFKSEYEKQLKEAKEFLDLLEKKHSQIMTLLSQIDTIKKLSLEEATFFLHYIQSPTKKEDQLDLLETVETQTDDPAISLIITSLEARIKELTEPGEATEKEFNYPEPYIEFSPVLTEKYFSFRNSAHTIALADSFLLKPNEEFVDYDKEGNIKTKFQTTEIEINGIKVKTAWTGGVLNQEGKMLDLYIRKSYNGNRFIKISLDDYAKARNKTTAGSKKQLFLTIREEIPKLAGIRLIMTGITAAYVYLYEIEYSREFLTIVLSDTMQMILRQANYGSYYPMAIFRLDTQKNPNAFYFMKHISERKAQNWNKTNNDIIKIDDLLKYSNLPSEKDIKHKYGKNYNYRVKIIKPFERDMNACREAFSWKYTKGNGSTWKEFREAVIEITWKDNPFDDQEFKKKQVKYLPGKNPKNSQKRKVKKS